MNFTSLWFVLIAVGVLIIVRLSPKAWKPFLLLGFSYYFYAWFNTWFCGLLAFSTLLDFWCGTQIQKQQKKSKRKRFLLLSICVNALTLFGFKYFNFFLESFGSNSHTLKILVPAGLSFYTLQSMSYTIDVYRRTIKAEQNLVLFSLYVSFFPQLIAGPIEKASNIIPQLKSGFKPTKAQVSKAVDLLIWGFFIKVVVADQCGLLVDRVYAEMDMYGFTMVLLAGVLFSIQLYLDFVAYSRIARGLAYLLGIELTVNFYKPFFSKSVMEFWKRWHITLHIWLKDYIYVPLSRNKTKSKRHFIILFVFIISGLWHGAGLNFIIWSVINGVLVLINIGSMKHIRLPTLAQVLLVNLVIIFTFFIFRCEGLEGLQMLWQKLLAPDWYAESWRHVKIAFTYGAFVVVYDLITNAAGISVLNTSRHTYFNHGVYAALLTVIFLFKMNSFDAEPFIYFQF